MDRGVSSLLSVSNLLQMFSLIAAPSTGPGGGNISTFCLQAHLDSNMCSTDDWEDLQSSSFTSQLENIHKKAPDFLELQRFMFYHLPQMIFTHFLHAICFLFPLKTTERFKVCVSRRVVVIWDISAAKNPADPTWKLSYVEELIQQAPTLKHRARANHTDAVSDTV